MLRCMLVTAAQVSRGVARVLRECVSSDLDACMRMCVTSSARRVAPSSVARGSHPTRSPRGGVTSHFRKYLHSDHRQTS